MVTDSPGADECGRFKPPFINDCSYPAAVKLLEFIYPDRPPTANPAPRGDVDPFDQHFAFHDENTSMNAQGHVYVPQSCRSGAQCPLHVALHGCDQDQETIEELPAADRLFFYNDAGYNEWAEQHGTIILYPQTTKSTKNPHACCDWWGYSGADYYVKTAQQISAIHTMVQCLTGEGSCP